MASDFLQNTANSVHIANWIERKTPELEAYVEGRRDRAEARKALDPRTGAPAFPHGWHALGVFASGGFWAIGWAIMWRRSARRRYIRIRTEQLRAYDAQRFAVPE